MTLLEKLNRLPPCLCRIFAKKNGRLMTDMELIEATGWSMRHLRKVYQSSSWASVSVNDVDTFLAACGLRWSSQRRQLFYLWRYQAQFWKMRHFKIDCGARGFQLAQHKRIIKRLLSNNHE